MSGQFIRSGEPPSATSPAAGKRFLAGVAALVGFQVRRFGVQFTAASEGAGKGTLLRPAGSWGHHYTAIARRHVLKNSVLAVFRNDNGSSHDRKINA